MQTVLRRLRPGIPLLAIALLAAAVSFACAGDDNDDSTPAAAATGSTATVAASPEAAFPVTFTDSTGTAVTVREEPKRIVSYSPGATEVLFAVGAGDRVAAVDQFSNYPPETKDLPKVQYSKPSPEQAITLKPDLVLMATNQEGQVSQFRALGLTVILLAEPKDVAGVLEQVRAIGRIAGEREGAEKVATEMQGRIDRAVAKATGQGPLVFFEVTPDLYTAGPSSFIGNLLSLMKARNVAEGSNPFPQLSAEALIDADPDVILLSDGPGYGDQSPDTVKARPGFADMSAVKNGRVYVINADHYTRPGPRVADALEELAALLYPTR